MREAWRGWSPAKRMALFLTCYPERSRAEAWRIAGLSWDAIPEAEQLQLVDLAKKEMML